MGPVELAEFTDGAHPAYIQYVAETKSFRGRDYDAGSSLWTDGVLYPDHLGIGFTERLADVPMFVAAVEVITEVVIPRVEGTASVAAIGDPPLLGDWIRSGRFQPDRLASRFAETLGGIWAISFSIRDSRAVGVVYNVSIQRLAEES